VEIGTERLLSKSPMNSSAKAEVSSMMRKVVGIVLTLKAAVFHSDQFLFHGRARPLQKQGRFLFVPNALLSIKIIRGRKSKCRENYF